MHDDVDLVVRDAEQVVSLDQLEPLVHQRRRVDRDLAAHRPRRMRERLVHRHVLELLARAPAEWSARGRQDEPVDRAGTPLAPDELEQRRVLGVDRDDRGTRRFRQCRYELTTHHQALFVREGEVDALAERGDRRTQSGRPDQRVEDKISAAVGHEPDEAVRTAQYLAIRPALGSTGGRPLVGEPDALHAELLGLVHEQLVVRACGKRDHVELRRARDDVKRLGADRPGGPGYDNSAHARSLGAVLQHPRNRHYRQRMPSEQDWHDKLRDALNERIERRDVQLALRVEADPSFPFEELDEEEFADWVEDWIGFTVASTAGPVMRGTSETEWVIGDNGELTVKALLQKRPDADGPLVVD